MKKRESGEPAPSVSLTIESLAFGGEGIAHHEGKVCFVPRALPGETVSARPRRARKRYDQMELLEVLVSSPDRVAPLCSHRDVCGGCSLQSLRYERQLEAKAVQVRELLLRLGGVAIEEPRPPLESPETTGYRNKMEFTFAERAFHAAGPPPPGSPTPALGLHVPGRFDLVFDLEDCVLPGEAARVAVRETRRFARDRGLSSYRSREDEGLLRHLVVREGKNTGECLVAIVVREPDPRLAELAALLMQTVPGIVGVIGIVNRSRASVARGEDELLLAGQRTFRERLAGLEFELQAQSFFQTNTRGAEVLVDVLRDLTPKGGRLLDLFCGAGTLGLALARQFEQVLGVEQVSSAVHDAARNARRNGIENAHFVQADAEDWVRTKEAAPGSFDVVVVDPPRMGLHPRALAGLISLRAPAISYVSCNPSTLARDLAVLRDAGYRARALQIVDLFPHTAHVESVVALERST